MRSDPDEVPASLLRRIRWGNVARAGALVLTVLLAIAWTQGGVEPVLPPGPAISPLGPAESPQARSGPAQPEAGIVPAQPRREARQRERADRSRRAARDRALRTQRMR